MPKLTRRTLFTVVTAAPLAAVAAQDSPQALTYSKDEDLKTARQVMANNAIALAKIEVPIATEPAFSFKV